jgi:hypothetical protein
VWTFRSKSKTASPPADVSPRTSAVDNPPDAVCAFCGKSRRDTGIMVEGPKPNLYICRACAHLIHNLFEIIDKRQSQDGAGSDERPAV